MYMYNNILGQLSFILFIQNEYSDGDRHLISDSDFFKVCDLGLELPGTRCDGVERERERERESVLCT